MGLLSFFKFDGIWVEEFSRIVTRGEGEELSSHCFVKTLRIGEDILFVLFIDDLLWDSNRWIISATRDEDVFVCSDGRGRRGGGGGGGGGGSTSESNDCEGRNVNVNVLEFDVDDGWRKNDVNCWLLLLFVVKSFTDVHRWVNVDEDIFFFFSSCSSSLVF